MQPLMMDGFVCRHFISPRHLFTFLGTGDIVEEIGIEGFELSIGLKTFSNLLKENLLALNQLKISS